MTSWPNVPSARPSRRLRRGGAGLAITAAAGLALTSSASVVVAQDGPDRIETLIDRETLNVRLTSDGEREEARLLSHLTVEGQGQHTIADPAATSGLRSMSGFSTPDRDGDEVRWDVDLDGGATDLRSMGEHDGDVPVEIDVDLVLDGEPVEADDLDGRSGWLEVTYTLHNTSAVPTEVTYPGADGEPTTEEVGVPLPLVGTVATTLGERFSTIDPDAAIVAGDGEGGTQLQWSVALFEPLGSETLELSYSAHTDDGGLPPVRVSLVPAGGHQSPVDTGLDSYEQITGSLLDIQDGASELDGGALQLADGAAELLAGLRQIAAGTGEMAGGLTEAGDGSRELAGGLAQALAGGLELQSGAAQLDAGAREAAAGAQELRAGAGELDAGADEAAAGGRELTSGAAELDAGADEAAAGGRELTSGAAELDAGASEAAAGGRELAAGAAELDDGVDEAFGGAVQILDGLEQVEDGLAQLTAPDAFPAAADGVDQLLAGAGQIDQVLGVLLGGGVVDDGGTPVEYPGLPFIGDGAEELAEGLCDFADDPLLEVLPLLPVLIPDLGDLLGDVDLDGIPTLLGEACEGAEQLEEGIRGTERIVAGVREGVSGPGDETLLAGLGELAAGLAEAGGGLQQLADGTDELLEGQAELVGGLGEISDGTSELRGGAGELSSGLGELADGTGELRGGAGELSSGLGELADGAGQLRGGAGELSSGLGELADGTGQLRAGTVELADGLGELAAGVTQLREGAAELGSGLGELEAGAQQLAGGLGEAVDGSAELRDGAAEAAEGGDELAAGAEQLREEGTDVLVGEVGEGRAPQALQFARFLATEERGRTDGMPAGTPDGAEGYAAYVFDLAGTETGAGPSGLPLLLGGLVLLAGIGAAAAAAAARRG